MDVRPCRGATSMRVRGKPDTASRWTDVRPCRGAANMRVRGKPDTAPRWVGLRPCRDATNIRITRKTGCSVAMGGRAPLPRRDVHARSRETVHGRRRTDTKGLNLRVRGNPFPPFGRREASPGVQRSVARPSAPAEPERAFGCSAPTGRTPAAYRGAASRSGRALKWRPAARGAPAFARPAPQRPRRRGPFPFPPSGAKTGPALCGACPVRADGRERGYFFIASSTATATATVAPTMGLLPMPIRPIISTCAGTEEEPANCASECMRPMVSVMP